MIASSSLRVFRPSRRRLFLLAVLVMAWAAFGCDFISSVAIQNDASVAVFVDVNNHGHPKLLQPGERGGPAEGGPSLGVNEELRSIRVWSADDPEDVIEEKFKGRRSVLLTVTGPPLKATVSDYTDK